MAMRDAQSNFDQVISFSSDNISSADVTNALGFAGIDTLTKTINAIAERQPKAVLSVVDDIIGRGHDLRNFCRDLLGLFRDLLVFKAKPDALSEDVNPDLQKSLAAQAELIETDRLLELIDQFAEAEGRMKWAPNKKLHFEVALIKAIQSLSQVTLNEVIENLNALRDGKDVSPKKPGAMPSARVAEKAPDNHGVKSASSNVDPVKIWEVVCAKIPPQKAFLRNSAASVTAERVSPVSRFLRPKASALTSFSPTIRA